jgi:hypothetical protein
VHITTIFRLFEKYKKEISLKFLVITGAPAVSIGVSKNGEPIWSEGFGFADVESGAKCSGQSVMRIASISKPITAAIAAHQIEQGKLDLDKSIHVRIRLIFPNSYLMLRSLLQIISFLGLFVRR